MSDLLARFDSIRLERDTRLCDLGPMPPWYRPFARRRWRHDRAAVFEESLVSMRLLARRFDVYDENRRRAERMS